MALKGVPSWINFFMQNLSTGRGVTARTTADFNYIKLLQDGVLGADIKDTTILVNAGAGYFSFSASTAQMNYSTIQRVLSPTRTTVQCFSPAIYTQGGFLNRQITSRLAAGGNVTVTRNNDKSGYSLSGNKQILDDLNDLSLTSTVDGVTISYALQLRMAVANARFSINGTQVTFYKRDNQTPLTTVDTSLTGRARLL